MGCWGELTVQQSSSTTTTVVRSVCIIVLAGSMTKKINRLTLATLVMAIYRSSRGSRTDFGIASTVPRVLSFIMRVWTLGLGMFFVKSGTRLECFPALMVVQPKYSFGRLE